VSYRYRTTVGIIVNIGAMVLAVALFIVGIATGDVLFTIFMAAAVLLTYASLVTFSFAGELFEDGRVEFRSLFGIKRTRVRSIRRITEISGYAGRIGYRIMWNEGKTVIWSCREARELIHHIDEANPSINAPRKSRSPEET
jgi:hypothetical protein